jgi:hypothetical protein
VSELLFAPLIDRIKLRGGHVTGSQLAEEIVLDDTGSVSSVVARCVRGQGFRGEPVLHW